MTALTVVVSIALLLALGGIIGYVRLLNGHVSLKFLAGPIERGLAGELGGSIVRIDDAIVRLTDAGGLEFRLRNVRLADHDGQPVASAPLAAVELAGSALLRGRIAPSRIELIDPRLLLVYAPESGLTLSFAKPVEAAAPAGSEAADAAAAPTAEINVDGLPAALQRIDLARALADTSARARRGQDATSHLREIGLRNATVVIQQAGAVTAWRVPEVAIDLEHKQKRSIIAGKATIVSGRAPWSLSFRTEESEKSNTIQVNAAIRDLVPRSLAKALPSLGLLDGFDLPVGGNAMFELSRSGDVLAGQLSLEVMRGRVQLPWLPDVTFPVDAGLVDLRYARDRARIELAPSTFRWGQSRVTLVGNLTSRHAAGAEGWSFDLKAVDGAISAEEFGVRPIPLETWEASGHGVPEKRHLELSQFRLKAGGAEIAVAGVVDASGDAADASFEGKIGPMPLATLKALWPRALAPGARSWVGERVTRAQIQGGSMKWLAGRHLGRQAASPDIGDQRLSLALEASDIAFRPVRTMSPIEAPRALVRLEGASIEIGMPDAAIAVAQNRRVPLRGGRFTAVDLFGDRPIGEIAFRVQAPLQPVLEVLDQEPLGLVRQAGVSTETMDGKADAQIKLTLPLISALEAREVKVEAKARLTEGRARALVGPYDVQGATIGIDIADQMVDAKGEMLVAGVPARLAWQRSLNKAEAAAKPLPLKLTARLDNSDRNQLGLDVNHMVQGDVPVEVVVTPVPGRDEPQVSVRADLTGAELVLDNIAWRKPPGSRATLDFDIVKGKGRTELDNFTIGGDNIAAQGQIVLGPDNRLKEFSFPSFTLNLVSQLEMQGVVRADNILDVKARSRHFDGRDFFRSLFSVGQVTDKPLQPPKTRAGVDVSVEIETLAGFSDVSVRGLRMKVSKRADKLLAVDARGTLDGGSPITVSLANTPGQPRRLRAASPDAGQAMRLIGFYPNMQGGNLNLEVNLDGKGAAEKTGMLLVDRFRILGDPIISEVVASADSGTTRGSPARAGAPRQVVRQVFEFDRMRAPFSVGYGQFGLEDSYMRGPLMGLSLQGKVDYKTQRVSLSGTYIPLQGLNNMLGGIPIAGQILSGPRSDGIFGITFGVQGSMSEPNVTVNPLSMLTPGFLRGLMEMPSADPRITPREPAKSPGEPKVRSQAPQGGAAGKGSAVAPEVIGGWSSDGKSR